MTTTSPGKRATGLASIEDGPERAPYRQATCIAAPLDAPSAANLDSDRLQPGSGHFVLVPGSATDEVDGPVLVEAAVPPGVLHRVPFATGERGEGLDIQASVVVEGVLAAVRAVEHTPPHRSPSARAVPPMSEVTRILSAIEQGDPHAAAQLLPLVSDELRRLIREEEPPRPSTRVSTLGQAATTMSANRLPASFQPPH